MVKLFGLRTMAAACMAVMSLWDLSAQDVSFHKELIKFKSGAKLVAQKKSDQPEESVVFESSDSEVSLGLGRELGRPHLIQGESRSRATFAFFESPQTNLVFVIDGNGDRYSFQLSHGDKIHRIKWGDADHKEVLIFMRDQRTRRLSRVVVAHPDQRLFREVDSERAYRGSKKARVIHWQQLIHLEAAPATSKPKVESVSRKKGKSGFPSRSQSEAIFSLHFWGGDKDYADVLDVIEQRGNKVRVHSGFDALIGISGPSESGKDQFARALAEAQGRELFTVDLDASGEWGLDPVETVEEVNEWLDNHPRGVVLFNNLDRTTPEMVITLRDGLMPEQEGTSTRTPRPHASDKERSAILILAKSEPGDVGHQALVSLWERLDPELSNFEFHGNYSPEEIARILDLHLTSWQMRLRPQLNFYLSGSPDDYAAWMKAWATKIYDDIQNTKKVRPLTQGLTALHSALLREVHKVVQQREPTSQKPAKTKSRPEEQDPCPILIKNLKL